MPSIAAGIDQSKFPGSFGNPAPAVTVSQELATILGKSTLAAGEKVLTNKDPATLTSTLATRTTSNITLTGGATATSAYYSVYPDTIVLQIAGLAVASAAAVQIAAIPFPVDENYSASSFKGVRMQCASSAVWINGPTTGDFATITMRRI
jgi:hypothetical protein